YFSFFFFQAEDGIRDFHVTGVQTCALPIYICHSIDHAIRAIGDGNIIRRTARQPDSRDPSRTIVAVDRLPAHLVDGGGRERVGRSEERRVGKECRSRWGPYGSSREC